MNPSTAPKTSASHAQKTTVGGLTYPSPIMGIPSASVRSSIIESVFDLQTKRGRESLAKGCQRLQSEAAAKVGAFSKDEKADIQEARTTYRTEVDAAEEEYQVAVRAAQSVRDRRLFEAKEDLGIVLAQIAAEFSGQREPVERDLKSSVYMLTTSAAAAQEELVEEFKAYQLAALKRESEAHAAAVSKEAALGLKEGVSVEGLKEGVAAFVEDSGAKAMHAMDPAAREAMTQAIADQGMEPIGSTPDGGLVVRKRSAGKMKALVEEVGSGS